ncbi:hypothetical protein Ptr86124_012481 [Pyrenophora tritici-repentis]|uniref:Uncharacterized protein n=1 Tax=Pyrenophora tritici-repentis TaxID=45151 RepID=A0A922SRU5_9PLEO|nr:hypothetical protein Ptr86124_012481 [Pyrenophora tritici-repentis]
MLPTRHYDTTSPFQPASATTRPLPSRVEYTAIVPRRQHINAIASEAPVMMHPRPPVTVTGGEVLPPTTINM